MVFSEGEGAERFGAQVTWVRVCQAAASLLSIDNYRALQATAVAEAHRFEVRHTWMGDRCLNRTCIHGVTATVPV